MKTTTAVIQARTGSTRLPGKVMYPLDGKHNLQHVIDRTTAATGIDTVIVATSTNPQDDTIAHYAERFGAEVIRGSETNVLSRFEQALDEYEPDILVRVTADCPLLSPTFIDASIKRIQETDAEYVSAGLDRTFPRGTTCETFTADSFKQVIEHSTEPHHREHVTPYYRENPEAFELSNITSDELFEQDWLQDRTDLRLTLDEPADYQLLETVYRNVEYEGILDVRDAIRYIDENGLAEINQHVEQKSV